MFTTRAYSGSQSWKFEKPFIHLLYALYVAISVATALGLYLRLSSAEILVSDHREERNTVQNVCWPGLSMHIRPVYCEAIQARLLFEVEVNV